MRHKVRWKQGDRYATIPMPSPSFVLIEVASEMRPSLFIISNADHRVTIQVDSNLL